MTAVEPTDCLEAQDLRCVRNDDVLFEGLSFSVGPGEVVQIDGPNGCGKTSLLRILCGLSLPEDGVIQWRGRDIRESRIDYQSDLAYVGHAHGVKHDLTALENLQMAQAMACARAEPSLQTALEHMGLAGFEDLPAGRLSAGQRRRVALARLRVIQARLWILDEPLTAVDKQGVQVIERLIAEHLDNAGMIVLTSHQPVNVPAHRCTNIHLRQ